jgi:hypothetical protein
MSVDRMLTIPPSHNNSELALVATLCTLFDLTRAEGRMLLHLVKWHLAAREELHRAMSDGDPVTGIKIIDVVVGRLRRKLKPHGIAIATIYGLGFQLPADSRERLRGLLAAYGEDVLAAAAPPTSEKENFEAA